MNMTCQKVRENLWDYHHGQVSGETAHSVRSHLETCSDCAAELQLFKQVDGALDGLAVMEPSPYFDQKLNAKLDEAETRVFWLGMGGCVVEGSILVDVCYAVSGGDESLAGVSS